MQISSLFFVFINFYRMLVRKLSEHIYTSLEPIHSTSEMNEGDKRGKFFNITGCNSALGALWPKEGFFDEMAFFVKIFVVGTLNFRFFFGGMTG